MQTRVCKLLFSNLYRNLSHLPGAPIPNSPSAAALLRRPYLPSPPPTAHLSSIPNRPSRRDRRGDDDSEDHFLRNLDFGDDGDAPKDHRSHPNPATQIPNRPLRGERKPEPLRGSTWPDEADEPSRTRKTPPARNLNRPMRGVSRDEEVQFQPKIRTGEEVYGNDLGSSRRNAPPRFANWSTRGGEGNGGSPMIADSAEEVLGKNLGSSRRNAPPQFTNRPTRGDERNGGSPKIADSEEDPISRGGGVDLSGGSLLRNLNFGEVRTGEKMEEMDPTAQTQTPGADPAVSESSTKDADEIFKKMKETGLIPNAVAMLDGLCKDGLVQEAMKLFGSMREKGSMPEVVVYTAVVEGFCKAEKFDDAKRVFRKMQTNGITPNAFSYTVLIQGLCKGRKLEDSVEFCMEMLSAGHSPNAATFTGLVEGFCTEKGVEEAESVIKGLRERGFAVDEKAVREHLDKKGPFSPMVREAIFGKKNSRIPF